MDPSVKNHPVHKSFHQRKGCVGFFVLNIINKPIAFSLYHCFDFIQILDCPTSHPVTTRYVRGQASDVTRDIVLYKSGTFDCTERQFNVAIVGTLHWLIGMWDVLPFV